MAPNSRRPVRSLIEDLFADPHRFELVQAIAVLERLRNSETTALGVGIDPELESVRIEQDPTLAFPASDVTSLQRRDKDAPPVLRTAVIGLAGASGPLPQAFTEMMLERNSRRDRGMAAFLDIFNHRLTSMLYRVFRTTLPLLDSHPERSILATALRAFVGIETGGLSNRLAGVSDRMLLGYAGIFADRHGSGAALQTVLSGMFQSTVTIRNFEGRWLSLSESSLAVLGRAAPDALRLGGGAVLGSRVWDQHAAFAVRFRFDNLAGFEKLLPIGEFYRQAVSICRFHAGVLPDIVFELTLAAPAVPPLLISARNGRRLGWTSWILGKSGVARHDGRTRFAARADNEAGGDDA